MPIRHHLSVDVEEYFHASAMEPFVPRSDWDSLPRRSPGLVDGILALLDEVGVTGTFFILGWLASREKEMVERISGGGHEVASHGWSHKKVTTLTPEQFREEVRRSKDLLEDLTGQQVLGYRAPSFSIVPSVDWALDVLVEEGYRYDSSMFPVRLHPSYGYPSADCDPHLLTRAGGTLAEIPPLTLGLGGLRIPAAGGAYLRFFPAHLAASGLRSAERREASGTLYFHPWELDRGMPAFRASRKTTLRMKGGIRGMESKLRDILSRFRFQPLAAGYQALFPDEGGEA